LTNGVPEHDINACHHVGYISFGDYGPAWLQLECEYSSYGPFADEWLIGIAIFDHEDTIDKSKPDQWDVERDEQIPATCFGMTIERACVLHELLGHAIAHAELFQNGLDRL